MDDMDDVAAFWQHHAEGSCPQGNPLNVWEELLLIAAQTPERFREALQAAAVAVGARYCNHDTPPGPLPDISKLPEMAGGRTATRWIMRKVPRGTHRQHRRHQGGREGSRS
ncbi:unnamed protein product [Ectocarpus sp. CCAP 1310/34]|nr:unnamed protein product [Ectocarpus sp. CCAP 1310/34]